MKYRKKPVVIEAVQLRCGTWSEMCDHAGVGKLEDGKPEGEHRMDGALGLNIPTNTGLVCASEGDWILKYANGELDACADDIFKADYEPVTTPAEEGGGS